MGEKVSKLNLWFKFYIDECNPTTYLNKTEAAVAAGYNCRGSDPARCFCSIGCQNYKKLSEEVGKWLDDVGLSKESLKLKLLSLMEAKESKFFSAPIKDEDGIVTGMHIESKEVDAIETQRKTLDMSLKMKGMYKPILHEVAGKNGKKIGVEHSLDESWKDLLSQVTGDNDGVLPNSKGEE